MNKSQVDLESFHEITKAKRRINFIESCLSRECDKRESQLSEFPEDLRDQVMLSALERVIRRYRHE